MLVTLVGLSGLIVAHQLIAQTGEGTDTRPNILVFVSDDMGWGQPGFNGGTQVPTPNMDRIANEGVKLTQFYVHPVCSPTRASLLTGRYPWKNGMDDRPGWDGAFGMLVDERTIAEALRDAGYATWMVGKWHLGQWRREHLPLQRGFDHHYGLYSALIDSYIHDRSGIFDWHRNGRPVVESGYSTFLLADEAIKLIERHDGSHPFFLYLPFNAIHEPHTAPSEFFRRYIHLRDPLQRAMLEAMDVALGRVMDALDRKGVLDDTLIVFLNDNGGPGSAGRNRPYRGGKGELWEGGIRVPAVLRWPDHIPAGSESDALLHVVDLFPTFAGLAGADVGAGLPLDGVDVWEAIAEGAESPRTEVVHSLDVIRVGDWKLMKEGAKYLNWSAGQLRLYNIAEDPYETTNLAAVEIEPEKVAELRARLAYHAQFARDGEPISWIPSSPPVVYGAEENAAYAAEVTEALRLRKEGTLGPDLLRLEVDGAVVALVYDKALQADSVPPADAFTLVLNPGYRSAGVTAVEVSGSEVVLTLAQATVSGDIVGLTYEVPASGAIQDVDGLAANGVTWISVEEEADPPPAISAVHSGDGALTVVWTAPDGVTGITAYDLRWILTSADETVDANWAVVEDVWTEGLLNHVLLGLTDGAEYDIQVRAVNAKGGGAWSLTATGGTLPNGSPVTVGTLAARTLEVADGTVKVRVSGAFRDPDGDALTFRASSSASSIVTVSVTGSQVTLTPKRAGSATITVTARDAGGSNTSATQTFEVTVAAARGVSMSEESLTVQEGSSESYTVILAAAPTGDVTVTVDVPSGADLSASPSPLTFTTGNWNRAQTVTVEAEQDSDALADAAVTIRHQVSGADYGSVTAPSLEVTIVEDDTPTLSVEDAEASEGGGAVVFRVELSLASSSDVTVDYSTSNGSGADGARSGSDYTAASGTLTFASGSTATQEVRVAVTDDSEDEEEAERFGFTLQNVTNASLAGGGSTLAVAGTILDNDDPEVEVQFGAANYDVTEGGSVLVTLHLSADPERTVTIPLEASHHGGATEADYSGLSDVTFNRGDTEKAFTLSAANDAEDDDGEAVVLRFGALPMGVSGSGETTVAILDTDGSGGGGGGGGGPPPSDDEDDEDDDGGGTQPPPPPPPSGPPKAAYTLTAECAGDLCRARTGLPVTFEDTSTGRVQSRRWDFGDGTGSRNRRIDHAWGEPGFYEVTLSVSDGTTTSTAKQVFLVEASDPAGTCVPDAETLCLQDSRYAVTVEWRTADGRRGPGSVVHEGTNDSGLFTFFSADNWEVLIKVLDGCAVNGHVWVYGASTTDLGYTIQVTDTATGAVKEYRNEPGLPASAITDGRAFPEGCQP